MDEGHWSEDGALADSVAVGDLVDLHRIVLFVAFDVIKVDNPTIFVIVQGPQLLGGFLAGVVWIFFGITVLFMYRVDVGHLMAWFNSLF